MASASFLKASPVLDKSEWMKGQSLSLPSAKSFRTHAAPASFSIRAASSYADELIKTAVTLQDLSKSSFLYAHGPLSAKPCGCMFLSFRPKKTLNVWKRGNLLVAFDGNDLSTNSTNTDVDNLSKATNNNQSLETKANPLTSSSSTAKEPEASSSSSQSLPKKSPLTAREKLRAARVLSRYTDSKPSKSELGSSVLDALRESDKGKRRSRLPEAPSNLLDDSKRGMPKPGLTFDFPGGGDLLLIAVSFVLISSIMFGTTYIVWKVGAIHFNEY